ncbi:MAG: NTP transferase domain-containing protein [Acidimicrobiia bacterium]|nr:NTP transferase domain-containing protein [Acidimicrobiia bacterium]
MTTTVVLCGGKGTRAYPHTVDVPKPLLHVDGRPVLEHVLDIYSDQGFSSFVLAAGYRCEMIVEFADTLAPAIDVTVRDTGLDTNTAGRILKCRDDLGDVFLATYADGLGDVNVRDLLAFHRSHDGAATVTTVPLPSQYGTLEIDDQGRVRRFREKPRLPEHRINAGFFVFDQRAFDHWHGEDLEREVLPALAAAGELYAFHHDGFWKSMDTYKESLDLTEMCRPGPPPWLPQRATPPPTR